VLLINRKGGIVLPINRQGGINGYLSIDMEGFIVTYQ